LPKAWLTIPSARDEADSTVHFWRERGYGVALFRDEGASHMKADFIGTGPYPGYANAVNALVRKVLEIDHDCLFCVAGGDDGQPDLAHGPDELADELVAHFGGTFGVCQFTGDRFDGGCIDRICGSPWMGREFCKRIYGGKGPLWPEFYHMFVDEHLQAVAKKLGILWQRPDLVHLHRHFARASAHLDSRAVAVVEGGVELYGGEKKPRPAFLDKANSGAHWSEAKGIFERLRRGGFAEADDLL
jgi:hypothetical protein